MIEELEKKYTKACVTPSDINQHLSTLCKYGKRCNHITEFGVRRGTSTWALLYATPQTLISYDINGKAFSNKDEVVRIARSIGVDYTFIAGDTLRVDIAQTDLLFLDTLHTYNQLSLELARHHRRVRKYMILHDTVTFSTRDEKIYDHASREVKHLAITKQGIRNAMTDFLNANGDWAIAEEFENNNGLTILRNKLGVNK